MTKSNFEPNVELDARMGYACMNGMMIPFGMQNDMTPQQIHDRSQWVAKQSEEYIQKVVHAIMIIEKGNKPTTITVSDCIQGAFNALVEGDTNTRDTLCAMADKTFDKHGKTVLPGNTPVEGLSPTGKEQ